MNTRKRVRIATALLALAVAIPLAAGAEAVLHGRVSFDAGGTLIKGVEESDWSSASVNTLVLPGDTLWVDNGGTTETEFSGGTFLRMADGSKAEIVSLPPNGTVRGWVGSFYIQRLSRSHGEFVFYTPAGAVEIEKDSMVRVDIVGEGITTVSTRWGRAQVRTDAGGTVYAHAGKRVFIETGLLPSEPTAYDRSAEDEFDRWNRERAEFLATGSTQTPASVGITDDTLGVTDLDRYGEWVYIDNRPCWRPTVVADYTPYRYGYWNYVGPVGNVWVGNYPFCYVTSHYGNWDYAPRYGWVWSYGREWSPAWCATVRYGDYLVWAPVNRYYRPVYPTTSAYFSIGGVNFGYYGTSCVRVSDLYYGPSYVHYANYDPFRQYYGHGNVSVNIWNINTNRRPQVQVPFNNSVTTVRDYTPRRSIRGATNLFASSRSASERVQRLETTSGRPSFSRADRTGSQFVRTDEARIDRSSRTRNVRLDQSTPDYTRATRSNPVEANNTPIRTRSGSDAVTLTNTRDRDGGTRGGTTITRQSDTARGTVPDRGTTSGRGGARGDNVARTDIDPNFGTTPMRTRTVTRPRDNAGATPRTSDTPDLRTSVPDISTPDRTRSTATSTRTQVRTSVPRIEQAPDRVTSRGPDSVPAAETPSRTPVATSSRGSIRERAVPEPSYTLPARTSVPDRSAPSVDYTTPSRVSTPRSNYTAPSRVTTPRSTYTAPSRETAPRSTYTAPSRETAPRSTYTAPSRETAPRSTYTAPSRETAPRSTYTAPSRETAPRSTYTAPSSSSSRGDFSSSSSGSSSSRSSFSPPSSSSSRTPDSNRGSGGRGR